MVIAFVPPAKRWQRQGAIGSLLVHCHSPLACQQLLFGSCKLLIAQRARIMKLGELLKLAGQIRAGACSAGAAYCTGVDRTAWPAHRLRPADKPDSYCCCAAASCCAYFCSGGDGLHQQFRRRLAVPTTSVPTPSYRSSPPLLFCVTCESSSVYFFELEGFKPGLILRVDFSLGKYFQRFIHDFEGIRSCANSRAICPEYGLLRT